MLQLKVNSEFVDLGSDPVISLDEESPVFEKDSIPGGFSFPFVLPITDRNRRIFQFPERIEKSSDMVIELDFELYHTGKLRVTGTIVVKQAGVDYQSYLSVGSGDFASKVKDDKLATVDLGGVRTWANKVEFSQEDDFALFPVYNPNFLNGLSGYNWEVNDYKLNHYESGLFVVSGTFAICPFPFLSYIVRRIFTGYGFSVSSNILETDSELKKLVLYSTYDAISLETTTEEKWIQIGIDPYDRSPIEEWIDITTTTRTMDTFDLADSMPDVKISDFLKWLRNRFNLAFVFDRFGSLKIIRRDHLITTSELTELTPGATGSPTIISIKPLSGIKLSWDHDPDDGLFAEEYFKKIDENQDNYKGPVANTSELALLTPEINDIYFVVSLDAYFQYAFLDDVGDGTEGYSWVQWSIGFQNYLIGEGKDNFNSGLSTLRMVNFQRDISGPTIRCPWTEQLSNGIERTEKQLFSARVLLYQGMQEDSNSDLYPHGSSDNLDISGNKIASANLTLKWEGEFGIYTQLWEDYLSWWTNRKQVNWIILNPASLTFDRRYQIGQNQYVLKKKSVHYGLHSINPGKCEFYLV